jgi:hypothetical protein
MMAAQVPAHCKQAATPVIAGRPAMNYWLRELLATTHLSPLALSDGVPLR